MFNVYKKDYLDGVWQEPVLEGEADNLDYVCSHLDEFGYTDAELQTLTYSIISTTQININNQETGCVISEVWLEVK